MNPTNKQPTIDNDENALWTFKTTLHLSGLLGHMMQCSVELSPWVIFACII